MSNPPPLDLAIIGGGIGGVVSLHYAKKAGLSVVLLEKDDRIGGLWSRLPSWQDIQIHPLDWTLGDLPIDGPRQPEIVRNIRAWVDRFGLADSIRLETPVTKASFADDRWTLATASGTIEARHLIAATGGHNRAFVPPVVRDASTVEEFHSSTLVDPGALTGRDVMVVGGGASAFDLLDLCFVQGAKRVIWVYRGLRWMSPTKKDKQLAGDIRGLARQQMQGVPADALSRGIAADLQGRYEKFGLNEIRPDAPFDFTRDQLIPGRKTMLARFAEIERHRGSVARLEGRSAILASGTAMEVDVVCWCTGYTLDLGFFESPRLAAIDSIGALAARCNSIVRSVDAPNLYFLAVGLESSGSAPWGYAHLARTIVSHIRGEARLDELVAAGKVNHFELARFLAPRDPGSFPHATWEQAYRELADSHPADAPLPIP